MNLHQSTTLNQNPLGCFNIFTCATLSRLVVDPMRAKFFMLTVFEIQQPTLGATNLVPAWVSVILLSQSVPPICMSTQTYYVLLKNDWRSTYRRSTQILVVLVSLTHGIMRKLLPRRLYAQAPKNALNYYENHTALQDILLLHRTAGTSILAILNRMLLLLHKAS